MKNFDVKQGGVGYSTTNKKAIAPYVKKIEAAKAAIISGKVVVPTKP